MSHRRVPARDPLRAVRPAEMMIGLEKGGGSGMNSFLFLGYLSM